MNIPRFAIQRPIFVSMVTLMVIIIGGVALFRLPIDLMPDITFPSITIRTEYENASPEVVEELITRPIEEAMAAVPGAEEVTSNSAEGNSNVTVKFSWGTDLDAASSDVRDRLDRVIGRLPDDAERPVLFKFDVSSMPIIFMGVTSEMDPVELRRFLDESVKFRIESIPGVASMNIFGGREREIAVNVDPYRIRATGISLNRVLSVLRLANINKPAGYVASGNFEITLRAPGEFASVEEIRDTVIATIDGAPVRIRDIAEVEDGMQRVRRVARINGREGVRMAVTKQSGSNTVAVAAAVIEELGRIREDYSHLDVVVIRNNADYINNSINNVSEAAIMGGGLAVVVILLFLRNILSTLVIAVSIPVSIIATFAILFLSDLTLNLMTLGGLALGVGMLVDNSIVVLENIYRIREEEGLSPEDSAEKGTSEVFAAIIASTLTTLIVFLPLVFIEGMAGLMFREFALVVSFSLLCSLAAAIVIVPMLASKIMRYQAGLKRSKFVDGVFNGSEKMLRRMENEYKLAIAWCLNHRLVTCLVTLALLAGAGLLAAKIDMEMTPKTDEGFAIVNIEMDAGVRLDLTDAKTKEIERVIMAEVPELKAILSSVGGNWWSGVATHQATINVRFGTREERQALGQRTTEQIADSLRKRFENMPGMTVRVNEGSSWGRGGAGGAEPVAVEIRGYDMDIGAELGRQAREIFRSIPGIVDARITREGGVPERLFHIDRRKAADLGLWVDDIVTFIEICMAGKEAAQYREMGKEYPINVRLKDSEKLAIDELKALAIMNGQGNMVSLRNVLEDEESRGPNIIERKNQQRVTTVRAGLSGRALGSAMDEVREAVRAIPMPSGFSLEFGTDYQDQVDMITDLTLGMLLALILVYMVMACQFESLRDPFVIMFSVPLAAIGVLVMLFLTNTTINMQSMIGCIMLAGIVVNNAIILVDQTNLLRREDGFSVRGALEEAGRRRLRPILMTALTTALGLVPMCFGWGDGGEAQAPMARAVVGGLTSSTFITLLVVPLVYSLLESGREAAGTTSKRMTAVREEVEPTA
ncbi:MAG: efflux RND transporter permease subunit [Planctomycetota bacterium]|jgi:HAE1 family hydrophobic/amphiphilic exporter-1|nr:efflux RND transporter permease subunit [Planctomycetota bacterium]